MATSHSSFDPFDSFDLPPQVLRWALTLFARCLYDWLRRRRSAPATRATVTPAPAVLRITASQPTLIAM